MARYLIEVSQPEQVAVTRISQSVRAIGSHFATHADWRQQDGVSIGTLVVEADDRYRALGVVPPGMRSSAKIFKLEPAGFGVSGRQDSSPHAYAAAA